MAVGSDDSQRLYAAQQAAQKAARSDLLAFMRYCWWGHGGTRLLVGRHTRSICDRITEAVDAYLEGRSTYLLVQVPPRHGKSDIVSRGLPSWFLGRCAARQPDVILSSYSLSTVEDFSADCHRIMQSRRYAEIFPQVELRSQRRDKWGVEGSRGVVTAQGLGGSITGKGGDLIVVDDYCKGAPEAASKVMRDRVWNSFRADIMTRQAPASIVIVCATPWHVDDLRGRILTQMGKDAAFPRFEQMKFPATKHGEDGWDYLFPERFTPQYYASARATLMSQAAALLDCEPIADGGNRFVTDRVVLHHDLHGWPTRREVRGWDLASSNAERNSSDPDWTWGIRGTVTTEKTDCGIPLRDIWIRDMEAVRAEAPKRDEVIRQTAVADGAGVNQHIEAFGGYKDTYTRFRELLRGAASVRKSRMAGDKSAKLAPLEPSFEAGRVHVYMPGCERFYRRWLDEFAAFPDGAHDDACDATAIMYDACMSSGSEIV